jgi:hypothetical protein
MTILLTFLSDGQPGRREGASSHQSSWFAAQRGWEPMRTWALARGHWRVWAASDSATVALLAGHCGYG